MIKKYKGVAKDQQTISKFILGEEDFQNYPMDGGKSEVLFSFLKKVVISSRGTTEKAAYILASGDLVLITEKKEEIVEISFVAGEKALRIIFKK